MTPKLFFNFLFLGLILGVSQSFLLCFPLIIFVYYSFLKKSIKLAFTQMVFLVVGFSVQVFL